MKNWSSKQTCSALTLFLALGYSQSAFTEGGGLVTDDPDSLSATAKTQPYSPYAKRNFPVRPLHALRCSVKPL